MNEEERVYVQQRVDALGTKACGEARIPHPFRWPGGARYLRGYVPDRRPRPLPLAGGHHGDELVTTPHYGAQGLDALQRNPNVTNWNGPYLKKDVPKDPWGNAYRYRCCPGQHGEYDLWSEGGDGAPGGEGENADVTSWAQR